MNHDVFISYSSKNPQTANAICHVLEQNKIKCWIAPRDISIGEKYGDVIERAIRSCKVFIIVFSKESSLSSWVESELNIAFTDRRIIMPFRIDQTNLEGEMRLILNNKHWIDAYPKPEVHFAELISAVARQILSSSAYNTSIFNEKKAQRQETGSKETDLSSEKHIKQNKPQPESNFIGLKKNPDITLKPGISKSQSFLETVNGISFNMVFIQEGVFFMGNDRPDTSASEKPAHKVTLKGFYIGETTVTQDLWFAIMGRESSLFDKIMGKYPGYFKGSGLPVENVTWYDTQSFLQKLNKISGKKYRLPSEAEWEYAAGGGNEYRTLWSGTDTWKIKFFENFKKSKPDWLDNYAWIKDNSEKRTHMVGKKKPNRLGLYDMSGNVWEWCSDWYGSYTRFEQINPTGPSAGTNKVLKGGSYYEEAFECRVSIRGEYEPKNKYDNIGFRLVISNLL